MRVTLGIILASVCVSCSTVERPSVKVVTLPKLTVEGVMFDDGLQEQEAVALSYEYFRKFVSGCGMPDKPQNDGHCWRVRLWGGYAGSDYGTLQIAKDGSQVLLLAPPKGGFKSVTKRLLSYQHLL